MPSKPVGMARESMIEHLLQAGLVTPAELEQCRAEQRAAQERGEAPPMTIQLLLRLGLVDANALVGALREQRGSHTQVLSTDPDEQEPLPPVPETLGKYQIVRLLAVGGMGRVYQAVDPELRRMVALKVLRDPEGGSAMTQRFQREARIAAGLHHPGIIGIQEVGQATDTDTGQPVDFIAMDYVEGPTLGEALTGLSRDRRLALLEAVAAAMGFAHARGVIHRDLKPANILLREAGGPVVTDFGLARGTDQTALTQSGAVMGTTLYMAPEQVRGQQDRIGPPTDCWALGVMLYQALTNKLPFDGGVVADVYAQILHLDPPLKPGTSVPTDLRTICLKALEKEPRHRYASGEELRADLERYRLDQPILARAPSRLYRLRKWSRRHRLISGALAGVLLCAAGLGAGWPAHRYVALQRLLRGASLAASRGEHAHALQLYTEALAIDSEDVRARIGRDAVQRAQAQQTLSDARRARALADRDRAATLLSDGLDVEALLRTWKGRRRPDGTIRVETPNERTERERALDRLLTCVNLLDRARLLLPDDTRTLSLRQRAGRQLGQVAVAGAHYSLARRAFEELGRHGVAAEEVSRLVGWVDTERDQLQQIRSRRLERMLQEVGGGKIKRGWGLADYVREAAGYRDMQTVLTLQRALEPLFHRARDQGKQAKWSRDERQLIRFISGALGQLGLPESVPPLVRLIHVLWDEELVGWVGEALCDTRRPEVYAQLLLVKQRIGTSGPGWRYIYQFIRRLPEPKLPSNPQTTTQYLVHVDQHMRAGRHALALKACTRAIALAPDDFSLYVYRCVILRELGRLDEAARDARKAMALAPDHPRPLLAHAYILYDKRQFEAALAAVRQALKLKPTHGVAWHFASRCLAQQSRIDEALKCSLQAIRLTPDFDGAFEQLARLRTVRREYKLALAAINRAVELVPSVPNLQIRALLLERFGLIERALLDLRRAIDREPDNPRSYAQRAFLYIRRQRFESARADAEKALALAPASWRGKFALGLVKIHADGDREAGRALLQSALASATGPMRADITKELEALDKK